MYPISRIPLLRLPSSFFSPCRDAPAGDTGRIRDSDQTLLVGNAAEPADLDPQVVYAYTDSTLSTRSSSR